MPRVKKNPDVARVARRLTGALTATYEVVAKIDDDPQALAELWAVLDSPQTGVTQVAAMVRDLVAATLNPWLAAQPNRQHIFPGVGVLEATWSGGNAAWQGKRLALVVAAQVADESGRRDADPLTGEIPDPMPPGVLAEHVALAIVACAGLDAASKTWRKKDLRARGIDPDEYVEVSGDRRRTVKRA